MKKRYKFFLISFILSLPFWWGVNNLTGNLEDFLFLREISKQPEMFTAEANQQIFKDEIERLRVERWQRGLKSLKINAQAAVSVLVDSQGKEKILFEKNTDQELPIASLTKLMTALVVLENYDLSKQITISEQAVSQEENFGKLEAGKKYQVKYLLYPLLIESSNDAAFCLANDYNGMTEEKFVKLMNLEAQKMNLGNTFFVNPTGLDLEKEKERQRTENCSTVNDLVKFVKELLNPVRTSDISNGTGKSLIWEILSTPKFNLYGPELISTNKFLEESVDWRDKIVGGKTGYTDRAGECFLLVLKAPKNQGYFINIVLRSDDRFKEMRKIVEALYL